MGTAKGTPPLTPPREKFIKSGLKNLNDREILEFHLNMGTPDKDYHQLVNRLLTRFKNLQVLLNTPTEQIQHIPGLSHRDVLILNIMQILANRFLKETILERPIYQSGRVIFDYLYHEMQKLVDEHFKMLCLDKNKMITEEFDLLTIKPDSIIAQSSRAAIEYAIKNGARYFVVAHNHLSGDPKPTQNDKDITRDLVFAGMIIQIKLLDHVIIGNDSFYSFSNEGLIDEYEAEFLDLKLRGTSEAKRRINNARKPAGKV